MLKVWRSWHEDLVLMLELFDFLKYIEGDVLPPPNNFEDIDTKVAYAQ
jgi:hypothetical protein